MTSTQPGHRRETRPTGRRLPLLVVLLLAVIGSLALTGSSSASFVTSTSSTGTVTAAADWTLPTVAIASPGAVVKGTTTVTASAADAVAGLQSVTIQRAAAGSSTWTTICTTTASPFSCAWSTTGVADGDHDLRAVATDKAGNTATSATTRTTVANALTVSVARPGDHLRGAVAVTSTVTNAGTLSPTVRVELAPAGTSTWSAACTSSSAPYTCTVTTTSFANGTYDLRSVATAGSTTYTSAVVTSVIVDNLNPTVTMTDPGTPIKGTKTFTVNAADAHSGVAKVVVQATSGTTTTDLCTITAPATTCSVDTTTLANGTYSFRAVATDKAGNTGASAAIANRVVQNTVSTVTLSSPAAHLRGTVPLTATTTTNGRITNVRFEQSVAGANSWTTITTSTSTTSTYTASWSTSALNGAYDLRAVLTESDGNTVTSNVVANRQVDNIAAKGVDVQTTNGGTAGRIDAGDTIVYTYSEQMDLSTIYAGWSGTATSGSIRVGGLFSNSQVLQIDTPTNVRLGSVDLNAYYAIFGDISADVSITAATVTTDGVAHTVVTVKVLASAGYQVGSAATMTWTPSASATDLAGNPTSTATVTESGPQDVDF
ncbi:MAG: Ig-like domain-containing protein [Aeromicrobium sp.]